MVTSQDISHSPKIGAVGWTAAGGVGLAVGAYCLVLRRYGLELADDGTLLAQMDRVVHGQVPYRDFHTGYGPALFYAHALLFQTWGTSIGVVRVGLAAVHALRATLAAALASATGTRSAAAILGIVMVGFFLPVAPGVCCPFLIPYAAWYADAIGLAAVIVLALRADRASAVVVGVLWGLAFAFKQNSGLLGLGGAMIASVVASEEPRATATGRLVAVGLALGLVAGALALLHDHLDPTIAVVMLLPLVPLALATVRARIGADGVGRVVGLGVGFLVVVIPVVAAMVVRAGGTAVATDLLQIGTDTARVYYAPYPSVQALLDGATHALSLPEAARRVADGAWFFAFPAVQLVAATWVLLARTGRRATVAVVAAVVGYLQLYPRMDFWHVLAIAPLSLAALLILLGRAPRPLQTLAGTALAVLALGRALPVAPVVASLATPQDGARLERVDLRWDLLTPPALRRLPEVVRAVEDRRSVAGFPALGLVNFALGRPSPWRHDYFFPGRPDASEETVLAAGLASTPPDAIVELDARDASFASAFSAHAALVSAIEHDFREERTIGPYRILVPASTR
jgi:hypothetical protein